MYIVFVGKLPQLSDYSLRYRKEWYKKKVKGDSKVSWGLGFLKTYFRGLKYFHFLYSSFGGWL